MNDFRIKMGGNVDNYLWMHTCLYYSLKSGNVRVEMMLKCLIPNRQAFWDYDFRVSPHIFSIKRQPSSLLLFIAVIQTDSKKILWKNTQYLWEWESFSFFHSAWNYRKFQWKCFKKNANMIGFGSDFKYSFFSFGIRGNVCAHVASRYTSMNYLIKISLKTISILKLDNSSTSIFEFLSSIDWDFLCQMGGIIADVLNNR